MVKTVHHGPEPAVIDEELCRKCIATLKPRNQGGEAEERKKETIQFREARALLLSYQNILKINNLVGFDKLIKLQLDNNIIEKIDNLGHLHNLEALDLSFNNISEISGLDNLTNLTNLSLFSNHITIIGGMDTLDKLQVPSLGNNLMTQLDAIMYLRPKTTLQAVNLVGNPFCQETEYRAYVLAHLKYLKYLDYRLVDEGAVTAAREQYQEELLDLEEQEASAETAAQAAEVLAEKSRTHAAANIPGMDTLFQTLMVDPDGEMAKLRALAAFVEPMNGLREQVDAAVDEFVTSVLSHQDLKMEEKGMFDAALDSSKAEASAESKTEISKYQKQSKRSLLGAREEGADHAVHAVLQQLHKANEALYEKLMDLEISSSERYAETIKAFESNFDELTKRTLECMATFFGKLRDLEAEYHEKLINLGMEALEKVAASDIENFPEDVRTLLGDKDTLMGAIAMAHDTRVSRLDAKEDELRQAEQKRFNSLIQGVVDDEYMRNRTRVIEVWKLVHEVHKKELESDRFGDD